MKWRRIPKENSSQPSSGTYSDWKETIAQECFNQCVYCAIEERDFGGIRNFHVEHFRPKSEFPELTNNIKNLFYACAICNVFKGNDWPNEPSEDFSIPCYLNPSEVDYSEIFDINNDQGDIFGKFIASKYMIEKLYLNRPQLIMLRRSYHSVSLLKGYMSFFEEIKSTLKSKNDKQAKQFLDKLKDIFVQILSIKLKLNELRPYEENDIRR